MPLKIMAVDDEPAGLKLMRSLVVPLGHNIQTFDDSEEAGQLAEEERFDVVFVGLRVPDPDGFELIHLIRNSEANRETPIVMLSGTDDIEILRKAFGEGATFVLPKPVPAARIIPMLAALESPWWKVKRASRLPFFTDVDCKCGGRQFALRSMNISESGMLLQPWVDIDEGEEVSLEFKITEVRASLSVRARVVRKDGTERVGMEFVGLAPEDLNAIQLYVMGHLKEQTRVRDLSGIGTNRFSPKD